MDTKGASDVLIGLALVNSIFLLFAAVVGSPLAVLAIAVPNLFVGGWLAFVPPGGDSDG